MKQLLYYIIIMLSVSACAQNKTVRLSVTNQPPTPVIFTAIKGDKQISIDTLQHTSGQLNFNLPDNSREGVYRLIFGQTTVAKVMNEPPQQLDFIYNGEDIEIETDFKKPLENAKVIRSLDNEVWFNFKLKEQIYQKQKKELEMQINFFQKNPEASYYSESKKQELINKYNQLQQVQNDYIEEVEKDYPGLFATKLIRFKKEPFLDGNLDEDKRMKLLISHYFDQLDFSDESLINSEAYTGKVFKYIMSYAQKGLSKQKQEEEFKKALDIVISKTSGSEKLSIFVIDYLMRGFELLGQDALLLYIAEHYTPSSGCMSQNNTLYRRLGFYKMKEGSKVPDFSLYDMEGGNVKLSAVTNKYKLILFWETTCPTCKQLITKLKDWYFNKTIDLEILAVSIDKDVNKWQEHITLNDNPWINLNEPHKWDGAVTTDYNLYATPTMFLIDIDNRIIAKPVDFGQLVRVLANLNKQ